MPSPRVGRFLVLVAFCCVAGTLGGCSPSRSEVSGTIKLKGQAPNTKGLEIVFMGPDGTLQSAPIEADGTYKATDVPTGNVKVYFGYQPPEAVANKKGRLFKPTDPQKAAVTSKNPVPEALREPGTSGITATLSSSKATVFDYDIK